MNVHGGDIVAESEISQQLGTLPSDSAQVIPAREVHPATLPPSGRPKDTPFNPESDEDVPVGADELKDAFSRPPPVNSTYLPLPWKGRLGYVSTPTLLSVTSSHDARPA